MKDKPSQVFGMKITGVGNNFDQKLAHLRDMGFGDPSRNSEILKSANGNLDKAVETLVRLGEGSKPVPPPRTLTPVSMGSSGGIGISVDKTRPEEKKASNNPWEIQPDRPQRSSSLPVTQAFLPPRSQSADPTSNSWNPFLSQPLQTLPEQSLQNSFQQLSMSQTGPTPQQQQQQQQYMQRPAVPQIPPQYQNNPFQVQHIYPSDWPQQPLSQQTYPPGSTFAPIQSFPAQPLGAPQLSQPGNPFLPTARSMSASPTHPWATQQPASTQQSNPWIIQSQSPAPTLQQSSNPIGPLPAAPSWQQQPQQQSILQQPATASPAPMVNMQNYFASQQPQPQPQPQHPQQVSGQGVQPAQPPTQNPWLQSMPPPQQQMPPQQPAIPQQQQFQQHWQTNQPSFQPQQPRHDKNSIMALYNMPNLAPRQPLQTLQEDPSAPQNFQAQQYQPAPPPQRSVTMPIQQGLGGMNPYMPQNPQVARHVSNESVDFVGMGAAPVGGRHSPDAFAGLSAQYMR